MEIIYDEGHRRHAGRVELGVGELVPCFEKPERAEFVLAALRGAGVGEIAAPDRHGLAPLSRVHSEPYLGFLRTAWSEWKASFAIPYFNFNSLKLAISFSTCDGFEFNCFAANANLSFKSCSLNLAYALKLKSEFGATPLDVTPFF